MYSQTLVQAVTDNIQDKYNIRLKRYSPSEVQEWIVRLSDAADSEGNQVRNLSTEERDFVRNENILGKYDFTYWCERYPHIHLDEGGGIGVPTLWEAQKIVLRHIANREEQQYDLFKRNLPVVGVRAFDHKARQLGATMVSRLITCHRLSMWHDQRAMAASVSDDKVMELYERDYQIFDNLPWWISPRHPWKIPGTGVHKQSEYIRFNDRNTRVLYQQSNQMSGLGQGRQFEVGHLTECASWPYPNIIELDFFPALSRSIRTICILESTAQGRGNWWHKFTEDVRRGHHTEWIYIFVPWYADPTKYRSHPPDDWRPADITIRHAEMVKETSHEYCFGRAVDLTREQMYWYETNRASAIRNGVLNIFLTNYCATPEESFQHTNESAFPFETLEELRLQTRAGIPYEFVSTSHEKLQ